MAEVHLPTQFEGLMVLVFGHVKVGKSSFINSIANSDLAVGHNLGATTIASECKFAIIDGVKAAFVNTPGFGQSGRSDRDVVTDVIAWVKENLGGEKGFPAVVDLQSIDTDAT
jgi:predicted GTPase